MTTSNNDALSSLADELRNRHMALDPMALATKALECGVPFDLGSLRQFTLSRMPGFGLTPDDSVIQAFELIASSQHSGSVLDPWAGPGYLIDAVIKVAKPASAIAITPNTQEAHIGKSLVTGAKWLLGDPLAELEKVGKVDLAVSCPPFNHRREPREITLSNTTIADDYGNLLVAKTCAEHLSPDGIGVFVFPSSFLYGNTPRGLRRSVEALGLGLSAAIHIPSGFWHGTTIETYLVILDRKHHSDIFVGEINQSKEHNEILFRNLFLRKRGSDLSSGYLADTTFSSYRELESRERAQRMARKMGVPATKMADVAIEINLTKSKEATAFPDQDNAVYVPLIGTSRAHTSKDDLSMKAHNYAQIVLDPSKALAPFVAGYFNSPLGRAALDGLRSGTTILHVTKGALQASEMYLPTLDIQTQCIQTDSSTLNLISELTALRAQIWETPKKVKDVQAQLAKVNHEDSLLTWMDGLPFPLSSVLWTYHASGNDDKAAYEHLLHFFEAFAEFHAIVLWSAMHSSQTLRENERYPLRPDRQFQISIENSSFGTWIDLTSVLSKFGRTLLNGDQEDKDALTTALGTRDTDTLRVLLSSDIITQMQKANTFRNRTTGHGGIVGKEEAQRRRVILENILASLRTDVGDIWTRFPLLKAGAARIKAGRYTYEAERIMGRSSPFQKSSVTIRSQIEDGALFLFAEDTEIGIPLAPLLLIGPSPETAQNAVYFYNRIEGDRLRFVSYNFEKEAEIYSIDSGISAALNSIKESVG